jgi:D-alanyl-D-alanine carboxypeptidase (penicillin-binding protein 5/6)
MSIITVMQRLFRVRLAVIAFTAMLVTACGGNPPPRGPRRGTPPAPVANQVQAPARSANIPPTPPPPVAAESAIVVDVASGRVIYAKNADIPRAVASTQKIITALCVIDGGNIDKPVTIAESDGAVEPTKLGLKAGEVYTRRQLLKVLMVKSANDVARALARDVGGDVDSFSVLMNRKAASLGMRNSNFKNPHGLTLPGQYSTARDMAIATRYAYRSPLLRSYVATREFDFVFNNGNTRHIENTNKVLKTLPYCNGFKTGTTDASGRCLVASGALNGRAVIVVVLKSNTPNVWKDATKLLSWSLERPGGA